MKFVLALCCSLFVMLGISTIRKRISEEPTYLPVRNGQHQIIYHLLKPGTDPRGEQEILSTPFGEFVLSEQPNTMTPQELTEARKIGEEAYNMRTVRVDLPDGRTSYWTYDSRLMSAHQAKTFYQEYEEQRSEQLRHI